jgi:hypothetical protein
VTTFLNQTVDNIRPVLHNYCHLLFLIYLPKLDFQHHVALVATEMADIAIRAAVKRCKLADTYMDGIFLIFATEFATLCNRMSQTSTSDESCTAMSEFATDAHTHLAALTHSVQHHMYVPAAYAYSLTPSFLIEPVSRLSNSSYTSTTHPTPEAAAAKKAAKTLTRDAEALTAPRTTATASAAPLGNSTRHCFNYNWKQACSNAACTRLHATPTINTPAWQTIYDLARKYHSAGSLSPLSGPASFLQGATQPIDLPLLARA